MSKKPLRILIADDDPVYRDTAAAELVAAGHAVQLACDGAEAGELLARETFDAAIVDLSMPAVDGLTVIRQLRSGGPNAAIPVIVITGHDDASAVSAAYEAGATSFLTKPLNWLLFTPHVAFVLRSAQTEEDLREAHAAAAFLSDLKSRVMAALANEFQAPVKSIFGFSQLISKEVFGPIGPAPYREMALDISNAAHRLNASLLKLLDFGRSLTDHLEIAEEVIPARKMVLDAVEASETKARRRDIKLDVDLDIPAELRLRADRALLNQALRGVLDDAIRLSPRGALVKIRGGVDPGDGRLIITTVDDGPPASAALMAEINATQAAPHAHAKAQAWPVETRDVGVKIARVLTEAHQGAMDITTAAGGSNTVRIALPRERLIAGPAATSPMPVRAAPVAAAKFAEIGAAIAAEFAVSRAEPAQ